MSIQEQKERLKAFGELAQEADKAAREMGKTAQAKTPILTSHLSLTIRNIDDNSRDEAGSVNSIQVAMDIATLANERGMVANCYKSSGNLILQISPKIKEQAGE